MATYPIPASDLTWLNMDRPTNLMVVNGVMWFDEEPDWGAVRAVVAERLIQRYDVLHRRPVRDGRHWVWEDDPDFDLDRHLRRVTLPPPGDQAVVQDHISARFSQPMDRQHPLWEMDLISGYQHADGRPGGAVLARFHHSLADGIRIIQLVLGLCDSTEAATPPTVGRQPSPQHPIAKAAEVGRQVVGNVVSYAADVARSALGAIPRSPSDATELTHQAMVDGAALVAHPIRVTDAITGLAQDDNVAVNTARSVARIALWGHAHRPVADQAPAVAKRVSWVEGIDLTQVKAIGSEHGATVNDVLISAVSLGMTRYLAEKGRPLVDDVEFLVPVSLKPVDASLPDELGNHFAMVMFPMPLGITDAETLLLEINARMARIKNSAEAMVIFGVQRAVAETPSAVAAWITGFVADKTVGLLTNVPGPAAPVTFAGTRVAGILGWVPTASDQSLGLCILSYAGTVSIGVSADEGIMPDPGVLAAHIRDAVDALAMAASPS